MKHKTKFLAALGLVTGLAVSGYALTSYASGGECERHAGSSYGQSRDGGKGSMHGKAHGMMEMMDRYDTNGDGALGKDEVLAERSKQFKTFDKNGDGQLDLEEYKALWADAMNKRMVRAFQRHDSNGDGKISEQDFNKQFARMLTFMDRNEDGKIDRDDMHQKRRMAN